MEKETRITVPLDADIFAALSAAAKRDGRAVSRQAAVIITQATAAPARRRKPRTTAAV